ncbi:hypothetical protein [Chamaesiphon polymorphus]|uniref:Uncharacterized protein n=1 Tax=Chamaesiphon polymorphus CCALA 037 TaxID=2107692 RepID=A0A2T1GJX8_9CYAN|nr:hypothetical protein [Chamaesiphon polymorphus]PSB57996.1 hypothetical protein C7B77_06410 [Chamaesiphon polymorphus CCALA 037]
MTEDSTPYYLPAERMLPTDDSPLGTLRERRRSIALTHSEWIELKIALAREIEGRSQNSTYSPLRLEQLKQLLGRLREESD